MSSFKSKMIIFFIRNRHLFKYPFRREVITSETSTVELRKQYEEGAQKFGAIPTGIKVSSVIIPDLPAGLSAEWIHPENTANAPGVDDKAIFYIHGGGYVSGNCIDHRMHVAKFVQATGIGALLYDYRLAPENPFPAAMEDTLTAYRWLLKQNLSPANIIFVGESAGGGLNLASLLAIRDSKLPLPNAGVSLSPWTDLKCTGNSYRNNAKRDISTLGSWEVWGGYYTGANDPENPWISPLYGDLTGLPPIMIQVGDHEILMDDSVHFAEKAAKAGVDITIHVWEGMVHCFPLLAPMFPEATQAWEEIIIFIKKQLTKNQKHE